MMKRIVCVMMMKKKKKFERWKIGWKKKEVEWVERKKEEEGNEVEV